jgi:hypothetical protein
MNLPNPAPRHFPKKRVRKGKKREKRKRMAIFGSGNCCKKAPLMVLTVTMEFIKHVNRFFNQGIDTTSDVYSFQDLFV